MRHEEDLNDPHGLNSLPNYLKEFKNFNPHPEDKFPYLDDVKSNNDELDREEINSMGIEIIEGDLVKIGN